MASFETVDCHQNFLEHKRDPSHCVIASPSLSQCKRTSFDFCQNAGISMAIGSQMEQLNRSMRATTSIGVRAMITLADCIALCGLTEDEVLAIAEHEHIPEIAAAALAQYLLNQDHGPEKIRAMIRDDIRYALARGDRDHARELFMALRHFVTEHRSAP